jgi:hypothetical protein
MTSKVARQIPDLTAQNESEILIVLALVALGFSVFA